MKPFFKSVFASLLGTLAAFSIMSLIGTLMFLGLIGFILSGSDEPEIESGSVLVFDLSVNIVDAPVGFDLEALINEALGGGGPTTVSLRALLEAISSAAEDDRIAALVLRGRFQPFQYGTGYATLHEVRDAINLFRERSGKPVYGFVEAPSLRDYYVASVADHLTLHPQGVMPFRGMGMEYLFLRDVLGKLGIEIQTIRAGDFKSATETFTEMEMSEENRAQNEHLLRELWGHLLGSMATSRDRDPLDWLKVSEETPLLRGEDAIRNGFIDAIGHYDELMHRLATRLGRESEDELPTVSMHTYLEARADTQLPPPPGRNRVAIVYLEGDILRGLSAGPGQVDVDALASHIASFREDPDVKAMVLRVNSPGGDVLASEMIRREMAKVREVMPVVVSFGTYAASGGYWAAMASDEIFALPATITGSIGVFGLIPNVEEMRDRIGLGYDFIATSPFALMESPFRSKTEKEMEVWQGLVDESYATFLALVAEGRGMEEATVETLASGRVWTGVSALERDLVDQYGGLFTALQAAADRANLGEEWGVVEFPRQTDFSDLLAEFFAMDTVHFEARPPQGWLGDLVREGRLWQKALRPYAVQARMPALLRFE